MSMSGSVYGNQTGIKPCLGLCQARNFPVREFPKWKFMYVRHWSFHTGDFMIDCIYYNLIHGLICFNLFIISGTHELISCG